MFQRQRGLKNLGKVISFDSKKKEYEKRHMYNCFNEEERRQLNRFGRKMLGRMSALFFKMKITVFCLVPIAICQMDLFVGIPYEYQMGSVLLLLYLLWKLVISMEHFTMVKIKYDFLL